MVIDAFMMLMTPTTLGVMVACAIYGLMVGAIPGFSAAMAVALMVPVSYFLDPVPALAGVMTLCAMAIFSGDIPGALLRIPGTPASAAYVDESYKMTRNGHAGLALGTGLICSSIGGIFGSIALILAAPSLGDLALQFSSIEYFWLACLGLTAAIGVSQGSAAKGIISLCIGLLIAFVGLDPVSGQSRFTFDTSYLSGGLGFIPVLIGLFASLMGFFGVCSGKFGGSGFRFCRAAVLAHWLVQYPAQVPILLLISPMRQPKNNHATPNVSVPVSLMGWLLPVLPIMLLSVALWCQLPFSVFLGTV